MREVLKQRGIDWLMHFTRVENLESIMKNGLVPRNMLEVNNLVSLTNDEYRFDNCENANCMSIEFPNYKMFYTLRCNNPNAEWAVLLLDAGLIDDFQCAFCYTNAGSEEIYSTSIRSRMNITAFENMFAEHEGYPARQDLKIPNYYPTNPQAEVLVFGIIPIKYIKCIIFKDRNTLEKYKSIIPSKIECELDQYGYFYGRSDYEFWR